MKKTIISILLITLLQNCGSSTTYNPPIQETVNVSPLKVEDQTLTEDITSKENSIDDEYTYVADRSSSAKTNQKSKNNKMLIYVVGGIVIAVAIAGTILFFRNTDQAQQAETVAKTTQKTVEKIVDKLPHLDQVDVIMQDISKSSDISKTLISLSQNKNYDANAIEDAVAVLLGSGKLTSGILDAFSEIQASQVSESIKNNILDILKKSIDNPKSKIKDWKNIIKDPKAREVLLNIAKGIKHNAKFVENVTYLVLVPRAIETVFHAIPFLSHGH